MIDRFVLEHVSKVHERVEGDAFEQLSRAHAVAYSNDRTRHLVSESIDHEQKISRVIKPGG